MKWYSLKTFVLHVAIVAIYITATSYFFVVARQPDPIGTGIRQWLCIFLHFMVTFIIMLVYLYKTPFRKEGWAKLFLHITAIVLIVASLLLFGNPLWEWLWILRG